MKEQFNVTVYYTTEDGTAAIFKAQIEFSCDPNTYGNGYYMGVKSSAEVFGFQAYDIRYDHDFDKNYIPNPLALASSGIWAICMTALTTYPHTPSFAPSSMKSSAFP